jgi:hypothetical protein
MKEGEEMKLRPVVLAMAIFLLTCFPVQANKPPRTFYLGLTSALNGAEIPAGFYDLRWESEKPGLRVTLWKNGQFFATATGRWVKHGAKYTNDAGVFRVNSDGSFSLMELRMAGSNKTIVFGTVDSRSITSENCR